MMYGILTGKQFSRLRRPDPFVRGSVGALVQRVAVRRRGRTATATAYEANPQDTKSPGLRFARHIATANLTYPVVDAPQAPTTVGITLTRTVDGAEQAVKVDVVVVGTPIGARFTVATTEPATTTLKAVTINGDPVSVQPADAAQGLWTLSTTYTPARPGVYTLIVTAQPPVGDAIPTTKLFRVIAEASASRCRTMRPR